MRLVISELFATVFEFQNWKEHVLGSQKANFQASVKLKFNDDFNIAKIGRFYGSEDALPSRNLFRY